MAPTMRLQKKKIAFIDDNAEFLDQMKEWQWRHSLPVYATSSVSECLKWVEQREIDTLVADLRMPQTDGLTVVEKARRLQSSIEIIILTGYDPSTAERTGAQARGISIYRKDSIEDLLTHLIEPHRDYSSVEIREMEYQLKTLQQIHHEWVADLVAILRDDPELGKAVISSADGPFTIKQLIEDIEQLRPRGVEYVRLWRRTISTLLQLKKK